MGYSTSGSYDLAEVRVPSHLHRLHRVTLFSAAICHITQGSKVIIQDDSRLVAGPGVKGLLFREHAAGDY